VKLTIEIVVATLNRPDCLERLLKSILIQKTKPDKVVIVDAGTNSLDYPYFENQFNQTDIKFTSINSLPGLTHQRNVGIKNNECDLLLFSDDDVELEVEYIEKVLQIFEKDEKKVIGGASGKMINFTNSIGKFSELFRKVFYLGRVSDGSVLPSGFATSINFSIQPSGGIEALNGCNMVYRKEVFDYFLFDENLLKYGYMEDLDFSFRVSQKFKLVYIAEAEYSHFPSPQSRLGISDRYKMLMRHHHYLFKKNFDRRHNFFMHYISLVGLLLQVSIFQRSINGFKGALRGFYEIVFFKNFTLPNFSDDFGNSKLSNIKNVLSKVRYDYAASFCDNKVVLDCGSGNGMGVKILSEKAKKVVGIDKNQMAVEYAKKFSVSQNSEFICTNILSLPFDDGQFDVVVCFETFGYISEKFHHDCMMELKRVLKSNGKFIFSTPNKVRTGTDRIAPANYLHQMDFTFDELTTLFADHFIKISRFGIHNPVREGSMQSVKEQIQGHSRPVIPKNNSIHEMLLFFLPYKIKDAISMIRNGHHLYPVPEEYQILEEDSEFTKDLIFTGFKN
jgi:GT2 family glycosyltransferase/SAM-dependent methyltransferase